MICTDGIPFSFVGRRVPIRKESNNTITRSLPRVVVFVLTLSIAFPIPIRNIQEHTALLTFKRTNSRIPRALEQQPHKTSSPNIVGRQFPFSEDPKNINNPGRYPVLLFYSSSSHHFRRFPHPIHKRRRPAHF